LEITLSALERLSIGGNVSSIALSTPHTIRTQLHLPGADHERASV
jgi:hypothetical protein